MQDVELVTHGTTAAVAADVDDAINAVFEGEIAPDCVIAAVFVDERVGA